jgi:5'(3')-deoxyribonucleotidase
MRIGVDIDGVLADFNSAFIHRVTEVTNKDLFPVRPFDIPTWNYPQHYGYTEAEVSAVWEDIKADPNFWYDLVEYPQTQEALGVLKSMESFSAAEVYFITARPGTEVKYQTEGWLLETGFACPTVLISSAKGLCARALNLTHYIDDRWENVVDVRNYNPNTQVFLLTQPWNKDNDAEFQGVQRVESVMQFLQHEPVVVG